MQNRVNPKLIAGVAMFSAAFGTLCTLALVGDSNPSKTASASQPPTPTASSIEPPPQPVQIVPYRAEKQQKRAIASIPASPPPPRTRPKSPPASPSSSRQRRPSPSRSTRPKPPKPPKPRDRVAVSSPTATETESARSPQPIAADYDLATKQAAPPEPAQPEVKPTPEPDETPSRDRPQLELTLPDAVAIALQNNRDIKNAYLRRILDRQDLARAEDKFVPNFTPRISVSLDRNDLGFDTFTQESLEAAATVSVLLPTGAQVEAGLDGRGVLQTGSDLLGQDLEISVTQPLARDFGIDVNRASVKQARLQERINILTLKSTLIGTVNSTISAYRNLLQAREQVSIEQRSLQGAQRQLEITQALIDAGRLPRVDIVQAETNVANRQVSLENAQNQVEQSRLDLIDTLDIDRSYDLVLEELPTVTEVSLDPERLQQLALENNPDYLQSQLILEQTKTDLLLAENEQRWNVDLQTSYTNNVATLGEDISDFRAGLIVTRDFGNLNIEQAVERARVQLQQAQNTLQERQESLTIEVNNRIRDIRSNRRQVELARRATQLAEQRLNNEKEKLTLGVGNVRLIDILNFEDELAAARGRELSVIIAYLNSITRLEQTVGITLDRWNVQIDREPSDN